MCLLICIFHGHRWSHIGRCSCHGFHLRAGLKDCRTDEAKADLAEAVVTRLADRLLQSAAARSTLASTMQHAPLPARLLLLLGVLRACERGKSEPGKPGVLGSSCRHMVLPPSFLTHAHPRRLLTKRTGFCRRSRGVSSRRTAVARRSCAAKCFCPC
jgi:hypothetical protein